MLFRHRPSARLLVVDYTGNQQTPLFTHTLFWGTGMQGTTAVPWYIFRMPDDIFAWQILCFTICFKPVQLSHSMLASSGQATLYPWAFDLYVGFFLSGKCTIQKIIWLEHWWVERGTNPSSAKCFVSQEQEHPQPKHPVTLSNASSNTPCQVKHPEKHQHDTLRPAKYPKLETGNPPDRPEIGQTHCLDKPNRPNSKYTMIPWLEL